MANVLELMGAIGGAISLIDRLAENPSMHNLQHAKRDQKLGWTHVVVTDDSAGNMMVWTGKAGSGWISPSFADRFAVSREYAERVAEKFNRNTGIHGQIFRSENVLSAARAMSEKLVDSPMFKAKIDRLVENPKMRGTLSKQGDISVYWMMPNSAKFHTKNFQSVDAAVSFAMKKANEGASMANVAVFEEGQARKVWDMKSNARATKKHPDDYDETWGEPTQNPRDRNKGSRSKYQHVRLAPKSKFDPRGFRVIDPGRPGKTKIVVGCPKGRFRKGRCEVGTQPQSMLIENPNTKLDHYSIGFAHGNRAGGTRNFKPGNRKPGGHAFNEYKRGFLDSSLTYHEAREKLARLNLPKERRNPRGCSKRGITCASQATGKRPSARLIKRRAKTAKAPKGFFANPVAYESRKAYVVTDLKGQALADFSNRDDAIQWAKEYADRKQVKLRIVEA